MKMWSGPILNMYKTVAFSLNMHKIGRWSMNTELLGEPSKKNAIKLRYRVPIFGPTRVWWDPKLSRKVKKRKTYNFILFYKYPTFYDWLLLIGS